MLDAVTPFNTDDRRFLLSAIGDIAHLKDKRQMAVRFKINKMTAKGDIKEQIINQFPIKKLMLKQLHRLGTISYTGQMDVLWKKEKFAGVLGTEAGSLNFLFALDENSKYVTGEVSSQAFNLGKVMDMKDIGHVAANAEFHIDISKPRTAKMRRQKGGKLPIGNVSALIEDCSYKNVHVRNLSATIQSDGAIAIGDIKEHGKHSYYVCSG